MTNSSIALQTRAPQIDIAAIEQAAQGARANDQASQLNAFKIQQAPAEMAYAAKEREHGGKKMEAEGAEMDANKAAGYPDIKKKLFDIYQGMTPEQYQSTVMKQRSMREAYNYIMSFPADSPERQQAFTTKLQELHKAGVIDDMTARAAAKSGASDLAMESVHRQLQMLEQITAGPGKETTPLQQSQIKMNEARAGYWNRNQGPGGKPVDPLAVTNRVGMAVNNLRRAMGIDSPNFDPQNPANAPILKEYKAREQEIYKTFGANEHGIVQGGAQGGAPAVSGFQNMITGTPGAATAVPGAPGSVDVGAGAAAPIGDGSEDSPYEPQGEEDMGNIPDGSYYVNPADGELYIKDSSAGELG